ncbi:hypothetical protein MUS1_03800 [Marinomonas ushuaiensis DSM 15871]|uniref:diguanylate cyclase n=1 Tax=Marinomonas ushuaiensis DSM 15871 TaxID=1122207 RepID=X7E2X0_9GAMM|nr:GGDEF domain-containing protein [Marinomonas ushuaiensis]ETX10230.1 hypothetical protein MUS1_03800 [Marinomonas ushuaiensis DSM 15871]
MSVIHPISGLKNEQVKETNLSDFVKKVGRKIGLATALLGMVTLAGYAFGIEFLYRPIATEPATNPLTALVVILLGFGLEIHGRMLSNRFSFFLAIASIVICVTHLASFFYISDFSQIFMLFESVVYEDLMQGKNNSMGMNTTLMLLLLAIAHLLYIFRQANYSQLLSFTALCIPMISITGYAYGLTSFYGAMSLLSTTFGVFLCLGTLAITADNGGVRAILSPYIGGRIARIQIVLGYFVPLIIGYLVIRSLMNSDQNSVFGIYVVSICWFIALLVVVSAIVQEQVDGKRREVEKALQLSAMTDELTQLPNRRHFMEKATEALIKEKSDISELSSWVLMVDIDHFKKINDTEGHEMGDKVLVEFALIMNKFVGPGDLVCRLGGEEFAFFFSQKTAPEMSEIANNILQSVEDMTIPSYTDVYGSITTSIGCAKSEDKTDIDHVLRLADYALYASKNAGRNRVMFAA